MCGLAGIFDLRDARAIDGGVLLRMNEAQSHRGPDEGGVFTAPGVGLAHRRLSIIDRAGGAQPMKSPSGDLVVVFNGEIYNHRELAAELGARGHRIKSRSDTETLLHAWREWGPACVEKFRGMFAFAIWDARSQTLFLARDRLGVKPLFYASLPNGFLLFASELKALLAHGEMARELDPLAIEDYFGFGYIPDPRTIYRAARKLPPGHTLALARGIGDAPAPRKYWDVVFAPGQSISAQDAAVELGERLAEAVSIRLEAEVPLGAFLSGGVDSSAVVAAMSAATGASTVTCSIGFAEAAFDETAYAEEVARHFGTQHHAERVGCQDTLIIDTLAAVYDEPFADSSALPTYRVCELAKRHVTVALSGDGADESFGGYRRYEDHLHHARLRSLAPARVRGALFGPLARAWPENAPRWLRAKSRFSMLACDEIEGYFALVRLVPEALRARLFSPAQKAALGGYRASDVLREHAAAAGKLDALSLAQYLDFKTYLPGDINTKVDRASMAHALEVREPMMDHRLVEWMAQLPAGFKIQGQTRKWLLKKTLDGVLPAGTLTRPKMGFAAPLPMWLRGPARDQLHEAVLGERLAACGFFEREVIRELVDDHGRGVKDYSALLWALMMFDAFLRKEG